MEITFFFDINLPDLTATLPVLGDWTYSYRIRVFRTRTQQSKVGLIKKSSIELSFL
jgi:hypothetical protein